MAPLTLSFFGAFRVSLAQTPISNFRSANNQGLLIYLAVLSEKQHARDVLATLFWPEETDQTARYNLRQSLHRLRKLLGDLDKPDNFELGGLDFPIEVTLDDAQDYTAVQLFVDAGRRVRADFSLTDNNATDVVHICRLVQGMPLGLVLAAAWLEILTPAEIAAEIESSLDFLSAELADLPLRQRSIDTALPNFKEELDTEIFVSTWEEGKKMDFDTAVQQVRSVLISAVNS